MLPSKTPWRVSTTRFRAVETRTLWHFSRSEPWPRRGMGRERHPRRSFGTEDCLHRCSPPQSCNSDLLSSGLSVHKRHSRQECLMVRTGPDQFRGPRRSIVLTAEVPVRRREIHRIPAQLGAERRRTPSQERYRSTLARSPSRCNREGQRPRSAAAQWDVGIAIPQAWRWPAVEEDGQLLNCSPPRPPTQSKFAQWLLRLDERRETRDERRETRDEHGTPNRTRGGKQKPHYEALTPHEIWSNRTGAKNTVPQ
jgi:hypothetical protein